MDIQEKIINTFKEAGQAMRPGELAEKAGLDKKKVEKAIKKMKEAGTLHSPKRCFYDITR
jgi:DNA-binding MarR family transcriptional regulator